MSRLRKLCMVLAKATMTGVDYYMSIPVADLPQIAKEVTEVYGRKKH